LDLGSALGAMGHYALYGNSKFYTGVEIQKSYRDKSKKLLAKYHTNFQLFETIKDISEKHDIVLACGYIHGTFDLFGILKNICELSNEYVIIETHDPNFGNNPQISFHQGRMVKNNGGENYLDHFGIETLPNKHAIDLIMSIYGFKVDERIYPEKIIESHDAYNTSSINNRFICRYIKTNEKIITLEESICGNLIN